MTTALAAPNGDDLEEVFAVDIDDDLTHVVRACDPDTALCGEHVPGDCFTDQDDVDDPECPECTAIERTGDVVHVARCGVCRGTEGVRWWW